METAVAFRQFLAGSGVFARGRTTRNQLRATGDSGDRRTAASCMTLATEIGCEEIFSVPDGVGGRFSVLVLGGA